MYAIVRAGGRQVRVEPKTTVRIDRLPQAVGDGVEFTEVLAVHNGSELTVGAPYVDSAKVVGRIVEHGRGRKIRVRTYRAKKRSRRHLGHRQAHTMVQILAIEADGIADIEPDDEPVADDVEDAADEAEDLEEADTEE